MSLENNIFVVVGSFGLGQENAPTRYIDVDDVSCYAIAWYPCQEDAQRTLDVLNRQIEEYDEWVARMRKNNSREFYQDLIEAHIITMFDTNYAPGTQYQ